MSSHGKNGSDARAPHAPSGPGERLCSVADLRWGHSGRSRNTRSSEQPDATDELLNTPCDIAVGSDRRHGIRGPSMSTGAIEQLCQAIAAGSVGDAAALARAELPFESFSRAKRSRTDTEKVSVFLRDGFIDRYSGRTLVFPGTLRLLSYLLLPSSGRDSVPLALEDCGMPHAVLASVPNRRSRRSRRSRRFGHDRKPGVHINAQKRWASSIGRCTVPVMMTGANSSTDRWRYQHARRTAGVARTRGDRPRADG